MEDKLVELVSDGEGSFSVGTPDSYFWTKLSSDGNVLLNSPIWAVIPCEKVVKIGIDEDKNPSELYVEFVDAEGIDRYYIGKLTNHHQAKKLLDEINTRYNKIK